jgi:hypothetical protein
LNAIGKSYARNNYEIYTGGWGKAVNAEPTGS